MVELLTSLETCVARHDAAGAHAAFTALAEEWVPLRDELLSYLERLAVRGESTDCAAGCAVIARADGTR
jgi:hypothetical protein